MSGDRPAASGAKLEMKVAGLKESSCCHGRG